MTTDGKPPLARLLGVTKVFMAGDQATRAVDNVRLDLYAGEMTVLLGPSGSGKTTLLTILGGLIQPTSGEVILFDRSLRSYTPAELQLLRALRIGFVFQTFLLIDALTVEENIHLVTMFAGRRRSGVKEEIRSLLRRLNIDHLARKRPGQLSQGEKQRVAIARAVVNRPDLLIADEPTASVDEANGTEIIQLLHEFAQTDGKSVLVTSHDQRVVAFADRVVAMRNGRIDPAASGSRHANGTASPDLPLRTSDRN